MSSELRGSGIGVSEVLDSEEKLFNEVGSFMGVSESICSSEDKMLIGTEVQIFTLDRYSVEGDGGS